MLFNKEQDALKYLQDTVPAPERLKEVDIAPLKEQLFNIPENLAPGHHEFEGKNGLKISFDLVGSDYSFDRCYMIFKDDEHVEGNYHPIYSICNLKIESNHFSYKIDSFTDIKWLPNLKSPDSDLSHKYVDVGPRRMYIIGQDGYLSRPIDLLGYFHELGHLETRSPDQLNAEYATIKTTISADGYKTEHLKKSCVRIAARNRCE
jgi:hypothetical protein